MLLQIPQHTRQPLTPPQDDAPDPTSSAEPGLRDLPCTEPGTDWLTCLQVDPSGFCLLHSVLR